MYIHERENWYNFVWDNEKILAVLASVRHLQGRLLGHMERLGCKHSVKADFDK